MLPRTLWDTKNNAPRSSEDYRNTPTSSAPAASIGEKGSATAAHQAKLTAQQVLESINR